MGEDNYFLGLADVWASLISRKVVTWVLVIVPGPSIFFGCSVIKSEPGSDFAQITHQKLTLNESCEATGINFFAIGRKGEESVEVSETVVFLPAGEYKLFFRIAHLSKWKGKCRIVEEIISHNKYNARSLDVRLDSGVRYEFDVNDDREPVFRASRN